MGKLFISQVENPYSNEIHCCVIEGNVLLLTFILCCTDWASRVHATLAVLIDQQETKMAFDSFQMLAN